MARQNIGKTMVVKEIQNRPMGQWARSFVKKTLRKVGVDIRRYDPIVSEGARLTRVFETYQVDLVIDVGANTGGYASMLRDGGYRGTIISFEPLRMAHDKLVKNARKDPLWKIAPRMALGAENGMVEMKVSANVMSSSALKMLPSHLNAAPESVYVAKENVPLRTLDELYGTILPIDAKSMFVKLDVQGYETNVIEGGDKIFSKAIGAQVELSLVPLYVGQKLFDEVIAILKMKGFSMTGVVPGFVDVSTGRMLQFDGIFVR